MTDSHPILNSSEKAKNALVLKSAVLLGALGVVFGDIGTSPLYAYRECFSGAHAIPNLKENVIGCVSLIFWFIVLIVCVKYVAILMKADNKGEGGVMALMALIDRVSPFAKRHTVLISLFGIFGAALLFSDAIITPAISVLSAVEGITVQAPFLQNLIIPISSMILITLFLLQSKGTAKIGTLFGPILLLWFVIIGALGLLSIVKNPEILLAINPSYAVKTLLSNNGQALAIIGTVFLSVTGAEVLYADMGHFGIKPIRIAWFTLVLPSLVFNYMGQGAYLLSSPGVPDNLFYRLAPTWFVIPLVIIATLATSIASQAVITGIFSLVRQAIQLGFWPRMRIVHTSAHIIGQVFVPTINGILCICTIALILLFKESGNLANAYGIAVSATMLLTTIMALFIARQVWKTPLFIIFVIGTFFIAFNSLIFIANLSKIFSGGWFILVFAFLISALMITWITGRKILGKKFASEAVPVRLFIEDIKNLNPIRVKGIAVFLSANVGGTPRALLHNYKHNKVLHESTLILNILNQDIPTVSAQERVTVTDFGQGIYQVVLKFGFMETPNVPAMLSKMSIPGVTYDPVQVTYFLGKERLILTKKRTMFKWQKSIFQFLTHNSLDATSFFGLPTNRVVELGMQIEL